MRWLHRQPTSTWTMHRQTVQAATSRSTARVFLDPILRGASVVEQARITELLDGSMWVRRCVSRAATRRDQALEQPVSMRRRRARHRAPSSPAARRLRPGQAVRCGNVLPFEGTWYVLYRGLRVPDTCTNLLEIHDLREKKYRR